MVGSFSFCQDCQPSPQKLCDPVSHTFLGPMGLLEDLRLPWDMLTSMHALMHGAVFVRGVPFCLFEAGDSEIRRLLASGRKERFGEMAVLVVRGLFGGGL